MGFADEAKDVKVLQERANKMQEKANDEDAPTKTKKAAEALLRAAQVVSTRV